MVIVLQHGLGASYMSRFSYMLNSLKFPVCNSVSQYLKGVNELFFFRLSLCVLCLSALEWILDSVLEFETWEYRKGHQLYSESRICWRDKHHRFTRCFWTIQCVHSLIKDFSQHLTGRKCHVHLKHDLNFGRENVPSLIVIGQELPRL